MEIEHQRCCPPEPLNAARRDGQYHLLAENVGANDLELQKDPTSAEQDVLTPFHIDENVLDAAKPWNEESAAVCGTASFGDDREGIVVAGQDPNLMRLRCRQRGIDERSGAPTLPHELMARAVA